MAAIKSYTDLSQSKKLAEFLPIKSADMGWISIDDEDSFDGSWEVLPKTSSLIAKDDNQIPCWSLAALLNVLPNNENISTNLSKGGYRILTLEYTNSWFVEYEDETDDLNNCVTSADNPVDACYEMILKLTKKNLL